MNPVTGQLWGTNSNSDEIPIIFNWGSYGLDWNQFDTDFKNNYFFSARNGVFHYCVSMYNEIYAGRPTKGISRSVPGKDFIIAAINSMDATETAGTIMHELGHNLGLQHGGNDEKSFKPNYISVMNGLYVKGITISGEEGHIDYSRKLLKTLNEKSLDEREGIGDEGYYNDYRKLYWSIYNGFYFVDIHDGPPPIDFDNSFTYDEVSRCDINNDLTQDALTGYNDWENLRFWGLGVMNTLSQSYPEIEIPDFRNRKLLLHDGDNKRLGLGSNSHVIFLFENKGKLESSYKLNYRFSKNWFITNSLPAEINIASGSNYELSVPVRISKTVSLGELGKLIIKATNTNDPSVVESGESKIIISNEIITPNAGEDLYLSTDTDSLIVLLDASKSINPIESFTKYTWNLPFSKKPLNGKKAYVKFPIGKHLVKLKISDGVNEFDDVQVIDIQKSGFKWYVIFLMVLSIILFLLFLVKTYFYIRKENKIRHNNKTSSSLL